MLAYVRSGGALWPLDAWWASRLAALVVPNVQEQAAAELVGVVLALVDAADAAAESEAA